MKGLFFGIGMQLKSFDRKPIAQQHPVQILLFFSLVRFIALQVFLGFRLQKMKTRGHKSKDLYEIEFPEPETLSNFNFFFGTGVYPQIPCKASHVQSITGRSKWLQFVQHLKGFVTCSQKILTDYLEYESLLQRMHNIYLKWFCIRC